MKKNIKNGFTLAELLIVLAIISIVSVMGLTISKKGVERAYDYYVYNSYKSISLAIGDAISNGCSLDTLLEKDENSKYTNFEKFAKSIHSSFKNGADFNFDNTRAAFNIKTIENVNYSIKGEKDNNNLHLVIYVPTSNTRKRLDFLFDLEHPEYGLIPASKVIYDNTTVNELIVLNRLDLLPFTIDDGETGKIAHIASIDNTGKISSYAPKFLDGNNKTRQKLSYEDAFCALYETPTYKNIETIVYKKHSEGGVPDYSITVYFNISCPNPNKEQGSIKLLDPKKIF